MMWSRLPVVVAVVLLVGGSPSASWGSCNIVPHDGTAENGFGAAPGFSVEYCGLIQPPSECTVDGWYFPVTQGTSFTRTGGQSTLTYTTVVREAVESLFLEGGELFPGLPVASRSTTTSGILPFPDSSITDEPFVLRPIVTPHFSCTRLDGVVSPGVFVIEDRSPTTPLNPGFGSTDGGPFERLVDLSVDFRALGTSAVVTPFAAQLDGLQVVPPVATTLTGSAQVDWSGQVSFQIPQLTGSMADITIRFGQEGTNGSTVCTFPNSTIPFSGSCPDLGTIHLIPLITAKIYAEIEGDALAEGLVTIRGQVIPANLLFSDGFETGDIGRW